MSEPQSSTVAGIVTGTAGFSFPLWSDTVAFVTGANQLLIAVLGLIVLVLTARKLWLENQLAAQRLREHDDEGK